MNILLPILIGLAVAGFVTFIVAITYSIITNDNAVQRFIEWFESNG